MQEITVDTVTYKSLTRLNDKQYINKYLEALNSQMEMGESIEVFFESKDQRRRRILNKFPKPFFHIYYALDFILRRVFPKLRFTKKIFYGITKGRNRVLSEPEAFGRIASCGFKIVDFEYKDNLTYVWAEKFGNPAFDMSPTYGALVLLNRVGYGGKLLKVYKFRTMHPYAEYIQEYMYERNQLREGGKIADDFRITSYGRWMRKLWIDEFPMFYNLFRGEMKLVGVRPLSEHFFSLYPLEVKELRIRTRPGLLPPFYADLPKTLEDVIESERIYLNQYLRNPWRTDWIYFWRAVFNIIVRRARSN
jgi:hypothetical protein